MTPHHWPVRVYYDDTDAGGIVYYANYLKFAERARTEWLRSIGLQSSDLRRDHAVLIVVKTVALDYHAPARLDDMLYVHTTVTKMGGSSMTLTQTVVRDGAVLCDMSIVLVCVEGKTFKPTRWPEIIHKNMQ
jgi:acyl-CoA thioester hydrolase